jgi:dTDP-4-amino-4,6-dideoxygalactose transaminase
MEVLLLELKTQYNSIKRDIDSAIDRILNSQNFILGEEVRRFEEEIANYCEVKHAIGVASGTDAILLSLRAAGIGDEKEDMVITSPFTFFATAGAIVNSGAIPVFVDIDPKTYNIDVEKIEKLLTENVKMREKVRGIIPVHLYGQMVDMDPLMNISEKYNIAVIEDACQAIGANYKGKRAGSVGLSGAFSFFPSKNLGGYGDGGMVVTNDADFAEKVRRLRKHGSGKTYYHDMIGYNSRLDAMQAAILNAKFPYLDKWSESRRKNAGYYNERFKRMESIDIPEVKEYNYHIYHQYTIKVTEGKRDKLQNYLKENNIGTKVYYPLPLHLQPCFKYLGYKQGDFPMAEEMSKLVLSLPIFPELTDEHLEYITQNIGTFLTA